MTKRERLAEVFRRLAQAAPLPSADIAAELLVHTINNVEDELSGLPYNPSHPGDDGRIYPPHIERDPLVVGALQLVSKHESVIVMPNGDITIRDRATERVVLFFKAGSG